MECDDADDAADEFSEDLATPEETPEEIMDVKAIKVSGIYVENRRYDCNGVYLRDGTTPGFELDVVPFFRNILNEQYL